MDSLSYREFPLELVPLEKVGEGKNRVHGNEEFEEELKKLATQISYRNFIWDENSHQYYRFASRVLSLQTEFKATQMEVFIIAFSKDLELLGRQRWRDFPRCLPAHSLKTASSEAMLM